MSLVKELFELPSLKSYRIELLEEGARKFLMTCIFAVIAFCFPYSSDSTKVHCLENRTLDTTVNLNASILGNYYRCECQSLNQTTAAQNQTNELQCVMLFHDKNSMHDEDTKKDRVFLGNTVCPLPGTRYQMKVFGALFIIYCTFVMVQIWWVHKSQDHIKGLLCIWTKLTSNGSCRRCIEEFVKNFEKNMCPLCDREKLMERAGDLLQNGGADAQTGQLQFQLVDLEPHQAGQELFQQQLEMLFRPAVNDRQKLCKIQQRYTTQNRVNLLFVVVLILFALSIHTPQFHSQFKCELPPEFTIEEDLPDLPKTRFTCLRPDAILLNFSVVLLLILNILLLVLFASNLCGREIHVKLCRGIQDTPKTIRSL